MSFLRFDRGCDCEFSPLPTLRDNDAVSSGSFPLSGLSGLRQKRKKAEVLTEQVVPDVLERFF